MLKRLVKSSSLLSMMNKSLINLPTPSSISLNWNFGSLLGILLGIQIITGILSSFHYNSSATLAFSFLISIIRDMNDLWLIKICHMNGATMFFILIYLHIGRNMYYGLHVNKLTWLSGTIILIMLMATAFLGYILPWGQMSFWGATVITNLLTVIPYLGQYILTWLWGDFSINTPTLTRFFSLHFSFPFILVMMVMIHLMSLHSSGSNNPLGLKSNMDKVPFHPYFSWKDMTGLIMTFTAFMLLTLMFPLMFNDPENFTEANPSLAPEHIQPEWYFLFAYAILRSIPNKLLGVIALICSLLIIMTPLMFPLSSRLSLMFYPLVKPFYWLFVLSFVILTWIGSKSVEYPYVEIGQLFSTIYFSSFLLIYLTKLMHEKLINI